MSSRILLSAALLLTSAAFAQKLECPAPPGAHACEAFHYHVLMYRPDTRAFVEVSGANAFASAPACERARAAAVKSNLAIVDFFQRVRNEQQYEADRFGACHCDAIGESVEQKRLAQEVRWRVREHLLDEGVASDSDLVRSLAPAPSASPVETAKVVPLPATAAVIENAASDLRNTKAADPTKPLTAAIDLPLVDVPAEGIAIPAGTIAVTADKVEPRPVADDAAEAFVTYETQRIQNVLKASAVIADESVKAKIFEACMQRIQLLSNLRRLIQSSGYRSRLADAARNAKTEDDRQKFIVRLFGSDMWPHWAPKDASDVIVGARPDVEGNPDGVLRDASGKYSIAQRQHALYVMLARSQPTEEQQLWLSTVVDSFLP